MVMDHCADLDQLVALRGIINAPSTANLFNIGIVPATGRDLGQEVFRAARLADHHQGAIDIAQVELCCSRNELRRSGAG
jgi:hypothetical protein